jgi:hypothetical protein
MRIMDVATALRERRETVERELNRDELKMELRDKLMSAAAVVGEQVTPEEVEIAVDRYFDTMYSYQEPTRGLSIMLAHLYLRRGRAGLLLFVLFAVFTFWLLLRIL